MSKGEYNNRGKYMKKILSMILVICIFAGSLPLSVSAADSSRSYAFDLTVEEDTYYKALPDEIVTVKLYLRRTDADDSALMYGMQNEILYDDTFFELVDGSVQVADGIEWTDMARRTGGRAFYLNFVGMEGGELWESDEFIGSFALRVIKDKGSSKLVSENCKVSTYDGSDSFVIDGSVPGIKKDAVVEITTKCTVSFDSCGGSAVEPADAEYGTTVPKPADPVREGYIFTGWYTNISKTDEWDFENDVVTEHMTLYAGWKASPVPEDTTTDVKFDTNGGSKVRGIEVTKGEKIPKPADPTKKGYKFTGWYTDKELTQLWDFENDVARDDKMTLYAGWEKDPQIPASPSTGDSADAFVAGTLFVLFAALITAISRKRRLNK